MCNSNNPRPTRRLLANALRALACLLVFWTCGAPAGEGRVGALSNFGDPNFAQAVAKPLNRPASEWREVFRWLQIGDSHTAGDYFTGEIRRALQARYGDGGMGWITPGYVKNQRNDVVKLSNAADWKTTRASRQPGLSSAIPPGGFIGSGGETGSGFRITFKSALPRQLMRVSVLQGNAVDAPAAAVELQSESDSARLAQDLGKAPWEFQSALLNLGEESLWLKKSESMPGKAPLIGGVHIERLSPGAIVSALGVNGAQIDEFLAWDEATFNAYLRKAPPNLVVLAFGTNETVSEKFAADEFASKVSQAIRRIRAASPAAILLVTPTDFRSRSPGRNSRANACGTPPANLNTVIDVLHQVAHQEQTLLWNWKTWAQALGAPCGTSTLAQMHPPLAREDWIHLTPEGYKASGEMLMQDLLKLSRTIR
ncbi:MAG: GDSL-type esterase/lipase family protein [Rhodocyclales bacterium]|nr:GDSL-type esterase/lipase family protein [Rhodocyclales bacterium]